MKAERKYFKVLGEFTESTVNWNNFTNHYTNDLDNRINNLDKNAILVKSFIVDKKHKNGYEVHSVYSSAEVVIYNLNTKKKITILFARPKQIYRLYDGINERCPKQLIKNAYNNIKENKNNL